MSHLRRSVERPTRVLKVADMGYKDTLPMGRKAVPHGEMVKRMRPLVGLAANGQASLDDPVVQDAIKTVLHHEHQRLQKGYK